MPLNKTIFLILLGAAILAPVSAPLALAMGMALGLGMGNPWPVESSRAGKRLLQVSVVGLGFGISILQVWEIGRTGLVYTVVGIVSTLVLGRLLAGALDVPRATGELVSFGTAICGGSAIAAMAPVLGAEDEEVGAAMATVFTLNAVALFVFPLVGHALGLSQQEFGYWAALAIHDTSSVVAAGSVYGATALAIATTVKLARAVWIAPITLAVAWRRRLTGGTVALPWFILGFLAAAALRALLPQQEAVWDALVWLARRALVVTLFLIGTGMTRRVVRTVGARALLHGLLLWILVTVGSLLLVTRGLALASG